jgi:hypothetical protein
MAVSIIKTHVRRELRERVAHQAAAERRSLSEMANCILEDWAERHPLEREHEMEAA